MAETLCAKQLDRIRACWWAANYLSVRQIYQQANWLLEVPLTLADEKVLLLGHRVTTCL